MHCAAVGCAIDPYATFLGFTACEEHYLRLVQIAQVYPISTTADMLRIMRCAAQLMLHPGPDYGADNLRSMFLQLAPV